ncbi:hypothetical protein F5888DRAFT_1047593 [Russula emetica]|nr:hypothetical protein F5888DRAFT_1047593 [Russula emetica]
MLHTSSIDSDKHAQVLPLPPNVPILPLHLVLPGTIRSSVLCRVLCPNRRVSGGMQSMCAFPYSRVLILPDPPRCRNDPTCVCANDAFTGAAYSCVWQSCSNSDSQTATDYWTTVCGGYGPSESSGTAGSTATVIPSSYVPPSSSRRSLSSSSGTESSSSGYGYGNKIPTHHGHAYYYKPISLWR